MDTIVLLGQYLDYSGYAWAGRSYAKMLNSRFENVLFVDNSVERRVDKEDLSTLKLHKENLNISEIKFSRIEDLRSLTGNVFYFECFLPSLNVGYANKNIPFALGELEKNKNINLKKISMIAWETNKFPETFCLPLKEFKFDALLLHTKEYKDEIEEQVGIKTYVNHYPVLELFNISELEPVRTKGDMFNILSFNAFNSRKGWDSLLNSYYSTFFDNEDVCLRIKTHGNSQNILKSLQKIKNNNVYTSLRKDENGKYIIDHHLPKCNIELDTAFLSEEEIGNYFKNFDLFATATKGEGFGLTIAQAGLSGLPILCPDKGGHNDFCNNSCFKVKSYTTSCTGLIRDFYNNKEMHLHTCDHQSLKDNFKKAYNEWKENILYNRGIQNKQNIFEYLNTPQSYSNILQIMEDLK